jgi:steroid 5-alpha reductase family enzyme
MSASSLLLIALCAVTPLFLGVYLLAFRLRNFGIVDVAWAGCFAPLALLYAVAGSGAFMHRVLAALLACIWSVRLALHLGRRVASHHPREDGRYAKLREEWAQHLHLKMGGFFVLQGLLVVLLSLPFALLATVPRGNFGYLEAASLLLVLLSVTGEALADSQLEAFKLDPSRRGKVCDRGLWRWSRHPNYFFEWLVWVGFALAAMAHPSGWLAWLCPLLMLWFLTRMTGIRYTEEQLLRSKGEAYRNYQLRTSAFLPWPSRRQDSTTNPSRS